MSDEEEAGSEDEASGEATEQELDAASLADVAQKFAEVFAKDLSALFGPGAEISVTGTAATEPSELDCPDAAVDQPASSEGAGPRTVHLLCPVPDAIGLGALQAGLEGDAVGEARDAGDFAAHAEGFGEVMKLAAAVLSRLLEPHGFGPLGLQAARALEAASTDTSWLGDATQWCIRLELAIEGFEPAPLLVLIERGASESAEEEPVEDLSVVIIDADEAERDRIEELGEENDREIEVIDPYEFDDDSRESIEEADAVIVAWKLGGRSGLELVEHLVRHERTSGTPALLAHAEVTRGMVVGALRAGARGFVLRPYDLDEIQKAVIAAKRG